MAPLVKQQKNTSLQLYSSHLSSAPRKVFLLRKIHYNPITLTRKPSLEAALIALDITDNEQITQLL